ncbi:ASCH domain protein [Aminobacter sp. MSH1]|uniref:ASCH domain-containing protein n=1 Tax=Aminobacter sp. MSH1 TaxID=374606 RepID=UPI000D3C4398|nr:ASCH domain-containing protein [Aminobacter sp. MSH1]AWC21308.1 ASCH domain protein [Aminobacter sp. MSH1]
MPESSATNAVSYTIPWDTIVERINSNNVCYVTSGGLCRATMLRIMQRAAEFGNIGPEAQRGAERGIYRMIGEKTTEVREFWHKQRAALGIETKLYHASTFADIRFAPYHDELLELVSAGKKRATAHLQLDFERNHISRRNVGDYWIILDSASKPCFLIRITDVDVRPFNEVEQSFAEREGEGDSSVAYWAEVHKEYFEQQCAEWGIPWSEDRLIVCEGFEVLTSAPRDFLL